MNIPGRSLKRRNFRRWREILSGVRDEVFGMRRYGNYSESSYKYERHEKEQHPSWESSMIHLESYFPLTEQTQYKLIVSAIR